MNIRFVGPLVAASDLPKRRALTVRSPWALAIAALLCSALATTCRAGSEAAAPPKVVIDTDYSTMGDDGQLGVMAAQLHAQGKIKVMGISVVSGNQWLKQGVADALKSVERLGLGGQIGVYAGANVALSHPWATIQAELAAGAGGDGYLGAWGTPEPLSDASLVAPPDGFALYTTLQPKSAVDFIVDTVKSNPNQITILAIGPLTNIAQATRRNPEIIPLIKRIIYMGGAIAVPGNTTNRAEFNWWFDPEAAQTVLRLPIPQVVVPLDVTNTVSLTATIYNKIAHPTKPGLIAALFQKLVGYGLDGKNGFETNPKYTQNIWDTLAIAYLVDASFATETVSEYVDVVTTVGVDDGHAVSYKAAPPAGVPLQKLTIVKKFDNARFFDFYVELLTRPVPIRLAD